MTTAAERLRQLAGFSGTAAAMLMAIGSGPTAGAVLVNYSRLPTGTAAEHLLAARITYGVPAAHGWPVRAQEPERRRDNDFVVWAQKWR